MKTSKIIPAKSELEYYKEFSACTADELRSAKRTIKIMSLFGKDSFMFMLIVLLSLVPWLIVFNIVCAGQWFILDLNIILVITCPIIYHFFCRKYTLSIREEANNAKHAYDSVVNC